MSTVQECLQFIFVFHCIFINLFILFLYLYSFTLQYFNLSYLVCIYLSIYSYSFIHKGDGYSGLGYLNWYSVQVILFISLTIHNIIYRNYIQTLCTDVQRSPLSIYDLFWWEFTSFFYGVHVIFLNPMMYIRI